jgi:23S rRNA pseudouridine2605 synthase
MNPATKIRLQKVIADSGIASRRQAEEWISDGRVYVNGTLSQLGDRCDPTLDKIEVDGRALPRSPQPKVVLAMHKPRGYLCTNADPYAKRTVFELLPPELATTRLSCVGRLDMESEGLLILTNNGELQQQLTHPSFQVAKIYHVFLDKPLQLKDIPRLRKGIRWEDERLALDKVFPLRNRGSEDWSRLEVTLHHGKKRELRRLFYAFDYDVKRLVRVQIGAFKLKGLPKGAVKRLTAGEIANLFKTPHLSD